MSTVEKGQQVRIHYTGRFPEGETFDSSRGGEPLTFQAGSDDLIPGVSNAVVGMAVGDQKTVEVPPTEGYGERDDSLVGAFPKSNLPEGVEVGMQLQASADGQDFMVTVTEIDDESVTVDANHPLAGKTLVFDVELIEILAPA